MKQDLPVSAIIATKDRCQALREMFESLNEQSVWPAELILCDGSGNTETQVMCQQLEKQMKTKLIYHKASRLGAAKQRAEILPLAKHPYILFMDDDIEFDVDCLLKMWLAIQSNDCIGGVNAMVKNCQYTKPGKISEWLFAFLNSEKKSNYAGLCLGPAVNLLPADFDTLPEIVPVEWLNTTCVLYRREALPEPLFSDFFEGYSFAEDLSLSLHVGKKWQLVNARTARILHKNLPGEHKKSAVLMGRMELVNRHYVMTTILNRRSISDYFKLFLFEFYNLMGTLRTGAGWVNLFPKMWGKLLGVLEILNFTEEKK